MFSKQELQVVVKTLAHRRDWLAKNLDNPDLAESKLRHQQTLQLIERALVRLQTIDTPGASRERAPDAELPGTQLAAEKIRVLIVDDDTQITSLLSTYLLDMGLLKIDVAENGLRAITMLYDAKPAYNLVLCNWNMPVKNGLDVHTAMRVSERYQDTCFMLVTANTEAKQIRAAIEDGVDDYLVKPIDQHTLYKKIARIFPQIPVNTSAPQ